jgi:hypothetical protein
VHLERKESPYAKMDPKAMVASALAQAAEAAERVRAGIGKPAGASGSAS